MASLFSGFNTARTGLMASQTALDVTSQNIANANTPGYTRQTLTLTSMSPDSGSYRLEYNHNQVGNGVNYNGVTQSRDPFLDVRYRDANSENSDWKAQSDALSSIEDIFNEFTSNEDKAGGLSGQMTDLVTNLRKYQNTPTDATFPTTIRSSVSLIAFTVNNDYQNLIQYESQEKSDLSIIVNGDNTGGGINSILDNIASLNKQISSYEMTGNKANDLRDQRNQLLDQLSGYVDINVKEQSDGMVAVGLANDSSHMLIGADNSVTKLQMNSDKTAVYWDDGNPDLAKGTSGAATVANIKGGTVDAYLQVINGDGSGSGAYGSVGIPYLKNKLNDFAVNFTNMLNSFAAEYKTPDTTTTPPQTVNTAPTALVHYDSSGDPAASLKVSAGWTGDASLFASNYTGTSIGDYVGELISSLNNNGTVTLNTGSAKPGPVYPGSILDFADSFTGDIATAANHVSGMADSTGNIVDNLDSQRMSISSVSIDDEGINIVKYQQAYNASARVITTIDEMLDKLINGTGTTT